MPAPLLFMNSASFYGGKTKSVISRFVLRLVLNLMFRTNIIYDTKLDFFHFLCRSHYYESFFGSNNIPGLLLFLTFFK